MPQKTKKFDPAFDQKSLLFRFQKHAAQKEFFKKSARILIACSGGPDSIALFHLMRLAFPKQKIALAHFNHGIRARTAKRDELFVKKLAAKYKIPFFSGRTQLSRKSARKKLSLEEAARAKRYEFLKKIYRQWKGGAVLFAHHLDDQAETVMMRICQGTGLRGLLGIRETMTMQGMKVVRPLLGFSKSEIQNFLRENHFSFCKDETNESTDFVRNRVRLEILPLLARKLNPRIRHALARIPQIAGDESAFVSEMERKATAQVQISRASSKVVLRAGVFRALHPALQFRILDGALKKLDPAAGLLYETGLLVKKGLKKDRFQLSLPRSMEIRGDQTRIVLQKQP